MIMQWAETMAVVAKWHGTVEDTAARMTESDSIRHNDLAFIYSVVDYLHH
jgi:hypothetical protein